MAFIISSRSAFNSEFVRHSCFSRKSRHGIIAGGKLDAPAASLLNPRTLPVLTAGELHLSLQPRANSRWSLKPDRNASSRSNIEAEKAAPSKRKSPPTSHRANIAHQTVRMEGTATKAAWLNGSRLTERRKQKRALTSIGLPTEGPRPDRQPRQCPFDMVFRSPCPPGLVRVYINFRRFAERPVAVLPPVKLGEYSLDS